MIELIVSTFLFLAGGVAVAWIADALSGGDEKWTFVIFWVIVIGLIVYYNDQQKQKKKKKRSTFDSTYTPSSYPSNWEEIRQSVLSRDNHRCGNCGSISDLDVHHIVPRGKGGTDQPNNLRTLCCSCHRKIHSWM